MVQVETRSHETELADVRLEAARTRLDGISSLSDMVAVLRETARAVAGSDGISVVLRDGAFCHYVAEDAVRPLWQGRRFRLEECISGWVMLHGRAAVVADVESDPRLPVEAYRASSMCSLVMIPIGRPAPSAALGAYWCAHVEPDETTISRLQALADMATAALLRVQSARRADRANLAICADASP